MPRVADLKQDRRNARRHTDRNLALIEQSLRDAGFAHAECFWRWMNFAGWIAVK